MQGIRIELSKESNFISASQLIERTNIISIISKRGRYGGTYAHRDIAFEFAAWLRLSPEFKYYLIKEFQRLKEKELKEIGWNYHRFLSKVNYRFHTDTIKEVILPALKTKKNRDG